MAQYDQLRATTSLSVLVVCLVCFSAANKATAQETYDATVEAQPVAETPTTAPAPATTQPVATAQPVAAPAPLAEPEPQGILVTRELQVQFAPGVEFFALGYGGSKIVGAGPAFKFTSQWLRWWGGFMFGGGTSLYYTYMLEGEEPRDVFQQLTLNGEMLIGGGIYRTFAVYAHLSAGAGVALAHDAETNTDWTLPWFRARVGVGGWYNILRWLSLGVIADLGWPGTIEALVTLGFHFGGAP
jgi:hypothetical protein